MSSEAEPEEKKHLLLPSNSSSNELGGDGAATELIGTFDFHFSDLEKEIVQIFVPQVSAHAASPGQKKRNTNALGSRF